MGHISVCSCGLSIIVVWSPRPVVIFEWQLPRLANLRKVTFWQDRRYNLKSSKRGQNTAASRPMHLCHNAESLHTPSHKHMPIQRTISIAYSLHVDWGLAGPVMIRPMSLAPPKTTTALHCDVWTRFWSTGLGDPLPILEVVDWLVWHCTILMASQSSNDSREMHTRLLGICSQSLTSPASIVHQQPSLVFSPMRQALIYTLVYNWKESYHHHWGPTLNQSHGKQIVVNEMSSDTRSPTKKSCSHHRKKEPNWQLSALAKMRKAKTWNHQFTLFNIPSKWVTLPLHPRSGDTCT